MINSYKKLTYSKLVLVNLKTGSAFKGYLIKATKDLLLLKNSTLHKIDSEPIDVVGEVIIEKNNVDFIQVIS